MTALTYVMVGFVAATMWWAAVEKIRAFVHFHTVVADLGFGNAAPSLAKVLVITELIAFPLLLAAPRAAAWLMLGLLALFSFVALVVWRQDRRVQCACFGRTSQGTLGPRTVGRNTALSIPLVAAAFVPPPSFADRAVFALISLAVLQIALLFSRARPIALMPRAEIEALYIRED